MKNNITNYIGKLPEQDFDEIISLKYLQEQFGEDYLLNLTKNKGKFAQRVAGSLLKYLNDTQKRGLSHINQIKFLKRKY